MAQSFTQSGTNITLPNNYLPFTGSPTSLDFGSDTVYIGAGAVGSFAALAGATLTAGGLYLGNFSVTGDGSFDASGIHPVTATPTSVEIGGSSGRLIVGNYGSGSMAVSGGAIVDATVNAAACSATGAFCGSAVANSAGSYGELTITGAGSQVKLLRTFAVGVSQVYTVAGSGFDLGTPGGTADGFVYVLDGGKLLSQFTTVGTNSNGPDGVGSEKANGTVVVSGAGSRWTIGPNTVDSSAAGLVVGSLAGGNGSITVDSGGKLLVDGTGGPGPNDFLNIASSGGKGSLTVSGVGSSVELLGVNPVLQVGRSGAGAEGSFSVLAGATAAALYMNVGRDSASGTLLIDGAGSTLTQSGVGSNQSAGSNGPPFTYIGRDGGTGSVTVSNGGQWIVSDGGGDGRVAGYGPGIALGRGANSTGSLTITGAGSKVEITSTSLNPGAGVGDNYNPFVGIGYDNPATTSGTLTISDGGKLIMTGNAVATATNPRATQLAIGGRSGVAGTGIATVTGAGSEIIMQGRDALLTVGRTTGGSGTLDVLDGGKVTSTLMLVGTGATGTVNIDNARIELAGQYNEVGVGAGLGVGRGTGGYGVLNMSNAASLSITPQNWSGNLVVGGDSLAQGGTGIVTLSGGSSITFGGSVSGNNSSVGRNGTGTLDLSGGSVVDVGTTGTADFGRLTTGTGHLILQSGSTFKANVIDFGGNSDSAAGGTATAVVNGLGSELKAAGAIAFIGVGRGGNGTLTVTDQGKVTGIAMTVGRNGGTGTFNATDATVLLSGQQTAGNLVGANLSIGLGGGIGTANLTGTAVTIQNAAGAGGANLAVGGSPNFPGGSGTLNMTNSTIAVTAGAAPARATIGLNGSGTAVLNASSLSVGDGNTANGSVFVGREEGSIGLLELRNGSVVNAGFVGVGVSAAGTGQGIGAIGGTGVLVLADGSKIKAPRFELGAGSTLAGNGDIDAGPEGQVVIAGTVSPGFSPGRIRIYCDVRMLDGSKLILEVDPGGGGVDQLVLGTDSTFDLKPLQIVFDFGTANPEDVTLDLNEYLRAGTPGSDETQSLASLFGPGQDWNDFITTELFVFESSAYDVTGFSFNPETGRITGVQAVPVPEPATLALVLAALVLMARQRRRAFARR